jgi:hypothetical protein
MEDNIPESGNVNDAINNIYEFFDSRILDEQKTDLSGESQKLIECPHELVFKIVANVLEENAEGTLVGSKEIYMQNYHIPVPSGSDYKLFLNTFFGFLEQALNTSADKTYEVTESKENKKNENKPKTRKRKPKKSR